MQDHDYESDVPALMETIKHTHSPPHRWQILLTSANAPSAPSRRCKLVRSLADISMRLSQYYGTVTYHTSCVRKSARASFTAQEHVEFGIETSRNTIMVMFWTRVCTCISCEQAYFRRLMETTRPEWQGMGSGSIQEPVCAFLGKLVPGKLLPHVNTAEGQADHENIMDEKHTMGMVRNVLVFGAVAAGVWDPYRYRWLGKNPSAHATRPTVVEGFMDKEQRT
ncbi:hypothetical protein LA080_005533 [Diaporthe eres]|nr:hypothetical protein LA080_005533 [Diaporthe eres]